MTITDNYDMSKVRKMAWVACSKLVIVTSNLLYLLTWRLISWLRKSSWKPQKLISVQKTLYVISQLM